MKNKITVILFAILLVLLAIFFMPKIEGGRLRSSTVISTSSPSSCIKVGGNTVITQFGITWTITGDKQCGQFANGDWWVVGPVTITNITPKDTNPNDVHCIKFENNVCTQTTPTEIHGTMINPMPGSVHGWDSRIRDNTYNSALNVSRQLPNLVVPANSSVVSAESHVAWVTGNSGNNPQLRTAAVLTVLPSVPPEGSFRPPLVGTDKTILGNKSQLNYGILKSLAPVPNTPLLKHVPGNPDTYKNAVENWFERPWIETNASWTGRYIHPDLNYPNMDKGGAGTYSRESSHTVAQGLLMLQLNYTNAEKETLYIRLVQAGIDVYGAAKAGVVWYADGGHNIGRKMPLILAGKALNKGEILHYADGSSSQIFQEDQQTFYVTEADTVRSDESIWFNINSTRRGKLCETRGHALFGQYVGENCTVPLLPYLQSDINTWRARGFPGIPEWGVRNKNEPQRNNASWTALYRDVASFPVIGHALAARIMGLESTWNHPAFFDYYDRFYSIESNNVSTGPNSIQPFVSEMWKAYRNGRGTPPPPPSSKTLSVSKIGNGTVTSAPSGINCGTDCNETYAADISPSVTLTATPATGYMFTSWSGACTGTTPTCTVTMNSSRSVTATFSETVEVLPFAVNNIVKVTALSANVRETPSLTGVLAGTQLQNSTGIIREGPVVAGGFTWWRIDYDTGVDGWAGQDTHSVTEIGTERVCKVWN